MSLHIHDTLLRRKVPFEPLEPGKVRMYHCGPTVYSAAHIGNFRSFLFGDVLRRWLELTGHEVTQVMNITDVGHLRDEDAAGDGSDRMEQAARAERLDPWQIADKYADLFFADLDALRFREAHEYPRATGHIPEMIAQIEQLLARGHAYQVGHEVYYSVESFADYGKLSGNTSEELLAGARVEVRDVKRDPRDFALWKHDPHHLMQWDSPWGRGFPGWHIECSAMSRKYLGETFDIHTGGEDNIFPHHECEIAQAQGATGTPFSRYWMHARHLQVDGGKMSKSLGNVYTVPQLVALGHSAEAIRFQLVKSQYRTRFNFTRDGLTEADGSIRRLRLLEAELEERADGAEPGSAPDWVSAAVQRFEASLDDDLNMSGALDGVFTLVHEAHRVRPAGAEAASALAALRRFDEIFAVLPSDAAGDDDAEIDALVEQREQARADKDWATADRLRDELAERGVELLDGKAGSRWRRV